MTSTELLHYDPVFARFQRFGIPILQQQLHHSLLHFVPEPEHDVNWRWWEPGLDDLDGLDYLDEARRLDPSLEDDANFLDAYESDSLAELGHLPRVRWYREARARQRARRRLVRQQRLTKAWASTLEAGVFTMPDHDESITSGTEEFASHWPVKARVAGKGKVALLDKAGRLIPFDGVTFDRQTAERYKDRSVAETAIFHPVAGDGLALDEMLAEMKRFEMQDHSDWVAPEEGKRYDHRYVARDRGAFLARKEKQVVELAELRARAVEICRFPWNDEQAKRNSERARGWVRRSRLLTWGSDTWQVIVTRKCYPVDGDPSDPRSSNHWTVFVRTHTGDETVKRAGRPDLQVWTWEPHYYLVFSEEEHATQWLERLEDAFLRENHGDLDQERWPNDLVNDRSVAAAQASAQWALWQKAERDGWKKIRIGAPRAPGQIDFEPEHAQTWDPQALSERIDAEYAAYEASE